MELPNIAVPIHTVTLPFSRQKVRIRPFLVKEERLVLMAAESKDKNDIVATVRQVLGNILVDKDVSVDSLPYVDVDYLFIAARAKSVGEVVTLQFICNQEKDGKKCGHIFPVDLDISMAQLHEFEDGYTRNPRAEFTATAGVTLRIPRYGAMRRIADIQNNFDKKLEMIVASIESIYDGESIISTREMPPEELRAFVENLTEANFRKLEEWVDHFPTFSIKATKKCEKCGFVHSIEYEDFDTFFL